jgi:hypothetical protein
MPSPHMCCAVSTASAHVWCCSSGESSLSSVTEVKLHCRLRASYSCGIYFAAPSFLWHPYAKGRMDAICDEGGAVMSGPNHTVSRTSNRHFGQLEHGIIGGGKLAVGREAEDTCIFEISFDNRTEALKLSMACDMCLHPVTVEELLPDHGGCLECRALLRQARRSGNGFWRATL